MALAGGLLDDLAVFFDVVQALADLDQPDVLVALDAGAVNRGRAAFAVVALAVPAVKMKMTFSLVLVKKVSKSTRVIAVL